MRPIRNMASPLKVVKSSSFRLSLIHISTETDSLDSRMLYHLLARKGIDNKHFGSYKYQGEWGLLDHIILSGSLLMPGSPLYTAEEKADVFRAPFLPVSYTHLDVYKRQDYTRTVSYVIE